jgi:DNA polymerase/3'-5' exonuclease PolX
MFLHAFALEVANAFIADVNSVCERIEIVGSLRRRREIVNDIDIIAIPKRAHVHDASLFGGNHHVNMLDAELSQLHQVGRLGVERNRPRMKRLYRPCDHDLITIDLYIATPANWWTLLLIRTGSRYHNIAMAGLALDRRMHLKADGSGIVLPDGQLLQVQSEEEIFKILGTPYRPPEDRE